MTAEREPTRIGLFGGSFDPIHLGHLILAEDALRTARLDRVVFLPAYSSPLRTEQPVASADDRLAMVEAAVESFPAFVADDFDLRQGRRVYSIETVREYRRRHPAAELFFLIGFDQFQKLPHWREVDELRRELTFLCAARENDDPHGTPPETGNCKEKFLHLPPRRIDISATEIRERVARGESIRSLVPAAVAERIATRCLYHRG